MTGDPRRMKPDPTETDVRSRMAADGVPPLVIAAFLKNIRRWNAGDLGTIPGSALAPLGPLPRLEELDEFDPAAEAAIARELKAATVEGQRTFIEAILVATASGRPRVAG